VTASERPIGEEGPDEKTEAGQAEGSVPAAGDSPAASTPPHDGADGAQFARLLTVLHRAPHEHLMVCYKLTDEEQFRSSPKTVAGAPRYAWSLRRGHVWYSINPLNPSVATGRGCEKDVIGWRVLPADLDVGKDGALPDADAVWNTIRDLAELLGTMPAALVYSGHGYHPYWLIERTEETSWPNGRRPPIGGGCSPLQAGRTDDRRGRLPARRDQARHDQRPAGSSASRARTTSSTVARSRSPSSRIPRGRPRSRCRPSATPATR
jgi:hypothetical protein